MKYLHEPVGVAAKACVEELRRDGGIGGVIALDNAGNGESRRTMYLTELLASISLCTRLELTI